jgi:hypothetical protein
MRTHETHSAIPESGKRRDRGGGGGGRRNFTTPRAAEGRRDIYIRGTRERAHYRFTI